MYGCVLKMRRGQEHFDALQASIGDFVGRDPYEIVRGFDAEANQHVVRVKVREWPSLEWSPMIGDVVHNMRSALDHLAWQLVIKNGRAPSGGNLFPIFTKDPFDPAAHATEGEFRTARRRWKERVRGMDPEDVEILRGLQPYQGADDPELYPLAALNRLSNWDKHRELHLATSAFVGPLFYLKEASRDVAIQPVNVRPRGDVFEDGAEVARFEAVPLGRAPYLDVHVRVMCEVAFGAGSPLEGLWIKQTLSAIGLYVSDVIFDFKTRFDRDGC